ncbi:hypothetical protein AAG906_021815 [Vitis piasezkii]
MVSDEENDELMEKAHSVILLCLGNEVFHEVVEEDTTTKLWLRLESLYMMKSLTNRLYLKKQLELKKRVSKVENDSGKEKTSNSSDVVVVEENSDTIDVLLVTVTNSGDEWILDLGCSYHMSPNRDWFSTYQPIDGTLDFNGCTYKAGSRVLRISKGAFVVVSHGGGRYMLTFINYYSRKIGKRIKSLRTNNGMKFYGEKFNEFCKNESKLEPKVRKCIFLGYANRVKWYRKKQLHIENDLGVRENVEFVTKALETIEKAISIMPKKEEVQPLDDKENAPQEQQYCLVRDRTKRQIKPPQRYAYAYLVAYALIVIENIENEEPQTYHEAITMENARFKAYLEAKGYTQKEGMNFNEVFSPIVEHSSIRMLLAMVALLNLKLKQLDVKTAFLHVFYHHSLKKRGSTCHIVLITKKYIEKVLEHFGMQESKLVSTPLAAYFKLSSVLSP